MNIKDMFREDEKPLENIVTDGGFCKIFRTIACVGDSLSSGEFELFIDGEHQWYDMYEYSWGQYMARTCGSKVYNFSRGGMTAKNYYTSWAESADLWNPEKKCQAYIIALGVNDLKNRHMEIGTVDDICENYKDNKPTFAGDYGAIIQRYKEIQPDAKFFLMTMVREDEPEDADAEAHAKLLYEIAEKLSNCYVIDFMKYAPVYDAEFKKKFYLTGHMNPMGYVYTAQITMSYIDYIIRHNMQDFKHVGFIGTDIDYKK